MRSTLALVAMSFVSGATIVSAAYPVFSSTKPNGGQRGTDVQLSVTGSIDIGATSILTLNVTSAPTMGEKYFLITNDLADPITGTFTGIPEGGMVSQGGYNFEAYYGADVASGNLTGGNDFALLVVPEPTGTLLMGLASLGLLRRRRK